MLMAVDRLYQLALRYVQTISSSCVTKTNYFYSCDNDICIAAIIMQDCSLLKNITLLVASCFYNKHQI